MVKSFAEQLQEAWELAKDLKTDAQIKNILVCGVGGSAIAGDILKNLITEVPIIVNRDYDIPKFVNEETLVFACSYSGNTEETRSAFERVKKKTSNYFVLTAGGELSKEENMITLPTGFAPREAIAYLFFPMLRVLQNSGIIPEQNIEAVIETVHTVPTEEVEKLSEQIKKIPVIYSFSEYSALAYRWQTQFEENSKTLAHAHTFTELNHNEIEAFADHEKNSNVLFIKDSGADPRALKQAELSLGILSKYDTIELKGKTLLAKMFYGVRYGDILSNALAVKRGVDASAIPNIDALKKGLKS